MDNVTYTVKKGDTLPKIAMQYGTTVSEIARLNDIENINLIYVGEVLIISGTGVTPKGNTSSKPIIKRFGLQSNTDRTMFATWSWDRDHTRGYKVKWEYKTEDGIWFVGNDSEVKYKQSIYTAPNEAQLVRFKVKAISETTQGANGNQVSHWSSHWSNEKEYDFNNNPPITPPVPTVELEDYNLRMSLENLDVNADSIEFKIVLFDENILEITKVKIHEITHSVSYSRRLRPGWSCRVACRSVRDDLKSDWSNYSSEYSTPPEPPSEITQCKAKSETSVYLEWTRVGTANTYDIEYTTKEEYFDGSDQTTVISGIEGTHYEKTGLETGEKYFFRVRSVNDAGASLWSGIVSVPIGSKPESPTTWSSTTTAILGEPVTLFWIHNCEDGSDQTHAEIEFIINDNAKPVYKTMGTETSYSLDVKTTEGYFEGATVKWRVRTSGVTNEYGDWSIQRVVDVYTPPSLYMHMTGVDDAPIKQVNSFPFYIYAEASPTTQTPIGYYLEIISTESYETIDEVGNTKIVNEGEAIYAKYFDISTELLVEFTPDNIDLENNIAYNAVCSVTMNSGLTANNKYSFNVAWTDVYVEPNAEMGVDPDSLIAYIRPYLDDENGAKVRDAKLSVYRREFDGTFTEIGRNVPNVGFTYVIDPHPSLDYARYRIVAQSMTTGAISYSDIPGYQVNEKSIVIQWDENWMSFDSGPDGNVLSRPPWSGSMLKLPYNVDVSDSYNSDVSLINYIGRKHPVSYYGTQRGETSTWNVEIPKYDKETLYAIRRLAIWMGDVYVREPSGSGYWASIKVSFGQKHCELTIPITFNITRVEGGM